MISHPFALYNHIITCDIIKKSMIEMLATANIIALGNYM